LGLKSMAQVLKPTPVAQVDANVASKPTPVAQDDANGRIQAHSGVTSRR
jgi:hypothetical protein